MFIHSDGSGFGIPFFLQPSTPATVRMLPSSSYHRLRVCLPSANLLFYVFHFTRLPYQHSTTCWHLVLPAASCAFAAAYHLPCARYQLPLPFATPLHCLTACRAGRLPPPPFADLPTPLTFHLPSLYLRPVCSGLRQFACYVFAT